LLAELYRWRDGQEAVDYEPLIFNFTLKKVDTIERSAHDTSVAARENERGPRWWDDGWMPILDNGGGQYLCIDTNSSLLANTKAVILYRHDSGDRRIWAPHLAGFLTTWIASLESGIWRTIEWGFWPEPEDALEAAIARDWPGFPRDIEGE
jgi:cell wall assembly regulator SMI1